MEVTNRCIGVKGLGIDPHVAPRESFRSSTHHSTGVDAVCRSCKAEYNRARIKGQIPVKSRDSSLVGRFLKALETSREQALDELKTEAVITPEGECWEWGRSLATGGYGTFRITRKNKPEHVPNFTMVHHWAFWLVTGEPILETIHHKCANRRCFNPDHLEQATLRDNVGEMLARRSYENRILHLEMRVAELESEVTMLKEAQNSRPS